MEFSSEKKINKLLSAYNHNDYELADDLNDFNAVEEISAFENRMKSKKKMNSTFHILKTNKLKEKKNKNFSNKNLFENIVIPEFVPEINYQQEQQKIEDLRIKKIEIIEKKDMEIIENKDKNFEKENEKSKKIFEQDMTKYLIPLNLEIIEISDNNVLNKNFKKALQKNRDLFCDLQREKNIKKEMEKKVQNLKKKLQKIKEIEKNKEKNPILQKLTETKTKLKKKKEKIASLNLQLGVKIKDIEKLKKILKDEIGTEIDINDLSKNKGNWVGRSQQIELYKQKIRKLQKRKLSGKKREKSNDTIKKINVIKKKIIMKKRYII